MEPNGLDPNPSVYSHPVAEMGGSSEAIVVDNSHAVDGVEQDIHGQHQQDRTSDASIHQVPLISSGSAGARQQQEVSDQQQHCSIVWLTSSDDNQSSVTGPLPPVSEVVNSQRSSSVSVHGISVQSQDNLQSYLTCSLPEDGGHSTNHLELISCVTSVDRAVHLSSENEGVSANIYSIAPSSVSGSHALTSNTTVHHLDKHTTQHYHADESIVHHLGLDLGHHQPTSPGPSSTVTTTCLPNFAEVSAGRGDSSSNFDVQQQQQRFYDEHNMVASGLEDANLNMLTASPPSPSSSSSQTDKDVDNFIEILPCYKCKLCSYVSLNRDGVQQHVRLNHSKELLGPEKPQVGLHASKLAIPAESEKNSSQTLQNLALNQKYICGICAKAFVDIESCSMHMNYDHNLSTENVHLEPVTAGEQLLNQIGLEEGQESTEIIHTQQGEQGQCHLNDEVEAGKQAAAHGVITDGEQSQATAAKIESKKRKRKKWTVKANRPNKVLVTHLEEKDSEENATTELPGTTGIMDVHLAKDATNEADGQDGAQMIEQPSDVGNKSKKKIARKPAKISLPAKSVPPAKDLPVPEPKDDASMNDLGHRCETIGCTVWLRSTENLEYHRKCHAEAGFECAECAEHFDRWKALSVHLWREHLIDMELYACDLCNYKTYSYSKLQNLHRRIHSDERPYLCDVCGKGFKTSKQLRNHKAIHLERKPIRNLRSGQCDVCQRLFSDKRMLRVHKDTVHNKLRPYLCNYCGYSASCRSTLKMHVRQHTGEKPFACDSCEYRTADHNSLRRHKMRHSGEKPYKCPFCTYACIQSSTYKAHLKNKHPGMDAGLMFCCDQCPFKTIKKENFVAHMADHAALVSVNASAAEELSPEKSVTMPVYLPSLTATGTPLNSTSEIGLPIQVVLTTSTQTRINAAKDEQQLQQEQHQQEQLDGVDLVHTSDDTNREHFMFSALDDPQQENIDHQVYKLEPDDPEERFPILAGQLKLGHSPSSSEDHQQQQQASLMHQHGLSIKRHHETSDDVQLVLKNESENDGNEANVVHNEVQLRQVGGKGTTIDVDTRSEDQEEEVLSHTQLTPVPPSEISQQAGPILW